MTTVRLPEDLENRLIKLSAMTHRPKSFYIREAITQYLEDMEDLYISLDRMTNKNRNLLTTEEILKKLEE